MRTLFISSFFIFLTQTASAQDGVRSSKKESNTSEAKTVVKIVVNNEKVATKDSTNTNTIKNDNPQKNAEKTSPNKKTKE